MSTFLIFLVTGLATGAVYALSGVGLVLTYRTSGIFNFGYGAVATVAAYLFYTVSVEHHMPWAIAAFLTIVVLGTLFGLLFESWARRARHRPLTIQVAATVGVLLVVEAAAVLIYPQSQTYLVPPFVNGSVNIFGAPMQWSDIVTLLFTIIVTLLIWLWLRLARAGIATRGVVEDDELVALTAISPNRVRRIAWVIGSMLACASGVLFAPLLPLDPVQLTLLVVAAFGAVAIGRFTSLPLTCVGGLTIGVLASLATRYITNQSLVGLPPTIPFLVLFLVILTMPRLRAGALEFHSSALSASEWAAPARFQILSGVVVLAALILVPTFAGVHMTAYMLVLGFLVLFLSLALLVRISGQVSLCHVTFVAIGAVALSHFTLSLHIPWFPALLLSGLVAVPIGAILAIPAIRLPGLFLALATFGFGILVEYLFYPAAYMFGVSGNALTVPRPDVFGTGDTSFYYVCLALALAVTALTVTLARTRLGRLLRGIGDGPTTMASAGVSVAVTRVTVFCLSAFLAAIAGGMMAAALGTASQDSYGPLVSLTYFTLIVIVIGREPWNALTAALSLALISSYLTSYTVSVWLQLVFGATAILLAVVPPSRTPAFLTRAIDRVFKSKGARATVATGPSLVRTPMPSGALEAQNIVVRFGGVVAVDNISVRAPMGQITGLIGPNGAGKTTLFNACSGMVKTEGGRVFLHGNDITRRSLSGRARQGLGRTFQQMQLFESLTVERTVALGREGVFAASNPLRQLISTGSEMRSVNAATARAMELCDLTALATAPVSSLSTGQRRLVDLARCIAGEYDIILLDEPSSGLNDVETEKVAGVLRRVVEEEGIGILLVEHDMSLVLELCAHVYVLDFGELIFEGSPAEVRASEVVHAVYLGRDTASGLVNEGVA